MAPDPPETDAPEPTAVAPIGSATLPLAAEVAPTGIDTLPLVVVAPTGSVTLPLDAVAPIGAVGKEVTLETGNALNRVVVDVGAFIALADDVAKVADAPIEA